MSFDSSSLDSLRINRHAEAAGEVGSSARRQQIAWLGSALLVALAIAAWGFNTTPSQSEDVGTPRSELPVTEKPRAETRGAMAPRAAGVLNASGYVVARRVATVSSKVTGRVVEILIEEGDTVEKGQLLARLDGAMARAAAELARRELEAAKHNLAEIEVKLGAAQREFERMQTLRARSLVSEAAQDVAQVEVRSLNARLAATEALARVVESTVDLRMLELADLDIYAPFAGVVISKNAQPGETVSPNAGGGEFTRTGIATIVDMESLEIRVDVNEAYISRVVAGQRVEATLDAYPNDPISAQVVNIVPTADRQKATVSVRIAFAKLEPRILPDMGIKVRFLDASPVPAAANKPT